jgi:hypothetical protein
VGEKLSEKEEEGRPQLKERILRIEKVSTTSHSVKKLLRKGV